MNYIFTTDIMFVILKNKIHRKKILIINLTLLNTAMPSAFNQQYTHGGNRMFLRTKDLTKQKTKTINLIE